MNTEFWSKLDNGAKLILAATAVAFLSMFLPWIDIGIVYRNGWQQVSIFFLVAFAYPTYASVTRTNWNMPIALTSSLAAVVASIWFYSRNASGTGIDSVNYTGVGCFVFLAASTILTIGVITHRS